MPQDFVLPFVMFSFVEVRARCIYRGLPLAPDCILGSSTCLTCFVDVVKQTGGKLVLSSKCVHSPGEFSETSRTGILTESSGMLAQKMLQQIRAYAGRLPSM